MEWSDRQEYVISTDPHTADTPIAGPFRHLRNTLERNELPGKLVTVHDDRLVVLQHLQQHTRFRVKRRHDVGPLAIPHRMDGTGILLGHAPRQTILAEGQTRDAGPLILGKPYGLAAAERMVPMKKLLVAVTTLVLVAVPGCTGSTSHPQASSPQTTSQQTKTLNDSGDVTMAAGDTLKVTLSANHSTPFWWAPDAQIADPTIVQQTGHEYLAGMGTGGPGTESWTFKALKPGATTITNKETNVTSAGTPPSNTFIANVTVR